jgi:uncharacterized glyoxalase superfamily protein PhnB
MLCRLIDTASRLVFAAWRNKNVTATYRQLSGRGVEFVKPPEKQPWGEFAIFKDPDGNQFVLSSQ